jgi:hypothetical protein
MVTAPVQYKNTTNTGFHPYHFAEHILTSSSITFHLTKKTLAIHFVFAYQNMYTEHMQQTALIFNPVMQVVIHNDGSRLLQH